LSCETVSEQQGRTLSLTSRQLRKKLVLEKGNTAPRADMTPAHSLPPVGAHSYQSMLRDGSHMYHETPSPSGE